MLDIAMDTLEEMIQAVQDDFTVNDTSALYNENVITRSIQRAYRKAGGLFRWPETEDAKKTSTEEDQEYYEYPDNWRPNSIWKLTVDDEDYGDPIAFKDYLYEKEEEVPSGFDKMWANQWRRFFIYPTPTTDGNNNISVWGQKVVDNITSENNTTIFSYSMPECNEAIVLEAGKILKAKGAEQNSGEMLSTEAKQILAVAFGKIKQELAKYERTQPMFEPGDLFARNGSSSNRNRDNRGRF